MNEAEIIRRAHQQFSSKGGKARDKNLSAKRKSEIAREGALAMHKKRKKNLEEPRGAIGPRTVSGQMEKI